MGASCSSKPKNVNMVKEMPSASAEEMLKHLEQQYKQHTSISSEQPSSVPVEVKNVEEPKNELVENNDAVEYFNDDRRESLESEKSEIDLPAEIVFVPRPKTGTPKPPSRKPPVPKADVSPEKSVITSRNDSPKSEAEEVEAPHFKTDVPVSKAPAVIKPQKKLTLRDYADPDLRGYSSEESDKENVEGVRSITEDELEESADDIEETDFSKWIPEETIGEKESSLSDKVPYQDEENEGDILNKTVKDSMGSLKRRKDSFALYKKSNSESKHKLKQTKGRKVGFAIEKTQEIERDLNVDELDENDDFENWLNNGDISDEGNDKSQKRDQKEVKAMISKRKSMAAVKIGRVQLLKRQFEANAQESSLAMS